MKVLLINNFHFRKGGSEAVYFNTAELLKSHGNEVVFFSYNDEKNVPCEQQQFFVDHKGAVGGLMDYFYNSVAAKKLEELIKVEKPDIAHVHLFWGGISPSIFHVLKIHNIPLVHTVHDYRMVCPAYTFKNGKDEICEKCHSGHFIDCLKFRCSKGSLVMSTIMTAEMYYRNCSHHPAENIAGFVFVSNFAKERHLQHDEKFKKTNNIVLYNYTTPMLEPATEKKDYILYYGRLSYEKGIPTLLEAVAKHPKLKLKVVGTGPIENELKTRFSNPSPNANLNSNIEFLGYKSGKELFELVRDAKFVCVPSEWYENNPMTIVEAYSLGTPVIGANIGGIPEIIEEGKTGYKFTSRDVKSLEETLTRTSTLTDEEYKAMCQNAYVFYQKNFSAENYYEKLMDFYNDILKNKK